MTVSSTTNRKTFTGDGATTSFGTSPVVFFNTSDLQVYVVTTATGAATLLTENTHYTVSGGSGSTGTVSTAGGSSPYGAPSAAQTLVIVRDLPITQAVDFVNNEASDAEVAEDALDKLVMIAQQLDARIDRSFTLADSDVSGASTQIPTPSANGLIKWNSGATALENGSAVDLDLAVVSPFMLTLLDDSTAADARTTLGTQASDAELTALAGLTSAANKLPYFTGSGTAALADFTAFARTLLDDADAAAMQATLGISNALPMDSLWGCTLSNNVSDATNDIDITAGSRRDTLDAENMVLSTALTKQLDAAWAVGTAAGGRDTGSIANGTWHWHLIKRLDTGVVDAIASLSPDARATVTMTIASPCVVTWVDHGLQNGASISFSTTGALPTGLVAGTTYFVVNRAADTFQVAATQGGAAINTSGSQSGVHTCRSHPVMPTNYTVNRGLEQTLREAGALAAFKQDGRDITLKAPSTDVNANSTSGDVTRALRMPTGVRVKARLQVTVATDSTAPTEYLLVSDLYTTAQSPSESINTVMVRETTGNNAASTEAYIFTDRNAQVRTNMSTSWSGAYTRIRCLGWQSSGLPRLT